MADLAFWIDRLLEFLRLRGPATSDLSLPAPVGPRMRAHGLRAKRALGRAASNGDHPITPPRHVGR